MKQRESPSAAAIVVATSSPAVTKSDKKKGHPLVQFIAGGVAGLTESSICHPLDTIKTRMQLHRQRSNTKVEQVVVQIRHSLVEPTMERLLHSLRDPMAGTNGGGVVGAGSSSAATSTLRRQIWSSVGSVSMADPATLSASPTITSTKMKIVDAATGADASTSLRKRPLGPLGTAQLIVRNEGFFALYKGLSAVYTGALLKFAIRFVSFEQYRTFLYSMKHQQQQQEQQQRYNTSVASFLRMGSWSSTTINLLAGMSSGLTEAVMVVTPVEVCKIRMQAQRHSLIDPTAAPKYRNVIQTARTIITEEGPSALYKGVVPTMLRQGINQAANFTAYHAAKQFVLENSSVTAKDANGQPKLEHWQSLALGGLSGAVGPMCNNPLDVVKTRLQKQVLVPGRDPKYTGLIQGCVVIGKEEGALSLWKGITPRLMRIVPGQAITFMTYEAVSNQLKGYFVSPN
mmetsp:Transcript_4166/g.11914  ORF Transcript_4166/g.11914 Transcript_4166/m.11914 type:complete len:457 (+) Transcript_4166:168-1538(+)